MNIASEKQEVQRLAKKYREEGYAVFTREDAAKILPEALHGVVPDLVVSKGPEHILVKVKTKGESEDRERIVKLAEAIQREPHWRLQVHLFEPDRRSCRMVVEPEILDQNRRSAVQLFESGQVLPALLLMWSVFEAAGARALHTEGVDVCPTWEHGSLVTELAFQGLIEDDEYERLRETQALRNLVAHGALAIDVQKKDFKQLAELTERLIFHNRSVG
jgi:REase_AHJR-like